MKVHQLIKGLSKPLVNGRALVELKEENRRLFDVLEINAILSGTLRLDVVLNALLTKAKEVCTAEACSIMLRDQVTDELYFHIVKGEKSGALQDVRLKLGEGISGWVAENKEAVLVKDCKKDKRFYGKADQKSSFETRTMMCVPLTVKDRVLGTIQVLNRTDHKPFRSKDLRIFQVLANQAAVAIENARLHEMATVDGMTGLYLKEYFMERLREEYQRAKHSKEPLSLLMSDIDLFKKVNDAYGHQGGDQALVSLATVIREAVESLESEDIAGRYGGEEFCVLLPGRDQESAAKVGELIRHSIESFPIPIEQKSAHITISIGIASFPLHAEFIEAPEDFVKLADKALYLCKDRGRNCVSFYESS